MSDRLEVDKSLIEPIYSQEEPNQTIDLGQAALQFEYDGTAYNKKAIVKLRFLPDDRLEFIIPLEDPFFGFKFLASSSDKIINIVLPERNIAFDVFYSSISNDNIVFSPTRSCISAMSQSSSISKTIFHLFNFPDFLGPESYILRTGEPPIQGFKTCGRVVLKADGWIITIAATDRTDDLEKKLQAQGGYLITHITLIIHKQH